MALCTIGDKRNNWRLAAEKYWAKAETAFEVYDIPLTNVMEINYLERILMFTDNDLIEVLSNLRKSKKKWVWLSRILIWEGADTHTSGLF